MRTDRDRRSRAISTALVGLALAACLSCASPSGDRPATPRAERPERPSDRGDRLVLAIQQEPSKLNTALNQMVYGTYINQCVQGYFAKFDENMELVPELIEAVPTFENGGVSADGLTISYKLREGVTWHDGQPFTAAVFDILVEVFHERLVEKKLITRALDELSEIDERDEETLRQVKGEFDSAYAEAPDGFMEALEYARDMLGERLVKSWRRLDPDRLTLWNAAASLMTVDRELTGMRYQGIFRECLRWRRFEP